MRPVIVLALALLPGLSLAQTTPSSSETTPKPAPPSAHSASTAALQSSVERLAQTNTELLDLLKKQQAVMEDIQFDRRLQSRQIQSLEERLQETLIENTQLQNKIDKLSAAAANPSSVPPPTTAMPQAGAITAAGNQPTANSATPSPPSPPASSIPPAPSETPGGPSWHRILALAGNDSRSTDIFNVQGRQWRIFWHNSDPDGKAYKNTSALFLNAFPKDDTVPQKVCAQLGTGGGSTMLMGPGNYYVKVEASGGKWEFAVEDFH